MDERVAALLDQIAGDGEAQGLLTRLTVGAESPKLVAKSIALTAGFERLYKRARTLNVGVEGRKDADPQYVDLSDFDHDTTFEEKFGRYFRPRLGKRADGFQVIFDLLLADCRDLLVVETGSMRIPGNWDGDGQSTFMFDCLVQQCGGVFYSIDVTAESLVTARRACSSSTQLILNDSVVALHALCSVSKSRIKLLYLDSFDIDITNPLPSAIHHIMELTAARPLIGPGSIVCVDDYAVGSDGGKGMILDKFFSSIRADVLHAGYQKVWRVR